MDNYNMTTNIKSKDKLCAVPWMHLNFEPNGLVVPCCLTSHHNYFAGDLKEQSIEDIWNSDNMKSLRKEMINGIEPAICNKCFDQERVTGESGRTYHTKNFSHIINKIPEITNDDGTCSEMNLEYWDFRFSNICNFKCRSCGPRYSSAWVPDAKKLGYISEQDKVWNIENVGTSTNFDFLTNQIGTVKRIYFAGGEPLMMDEHWQILQLLVDNSRFDVKVNYNTNCSILTYGKKNVLDYWKLWNPGKMEIWPSIDEIDERAELIRSGTVWKKVESNLIQLSKLDNIIVRPGITVGAMNVFRLPEIITRLVDIGVISKSRFHNYDNFFINMLMDPKHYHVQILPNDFKLKVVDKLEKFIIEFEKTYSTKIEWIFSHILHELTIPFVKQTASKFLSITAQLDLLRDEDTFTTIPEMTLVKDVVEDIAEIDNAKSKKIIPIFPVVSANTSMTKTATPVVYNSNNIVEIQNKQNSLTLTWIINNICTNHCTYCPEEIHSGKNHNYNWKHAHKFINACFVKYKNIHFNISGGEPTVSPFFKELVQLINDNNGTVHLTTNLVRPVRYWKGFAKQFISIAASYHPEFMTLQQEDDFIEKIKYISQETCICVRVMMLPTHWNQCMNFYNRIIKEDGGRFTVEMVRILPNFGVGNDYCLIEYTEEMISILNSSSILFVDNIKKVTFDNPKFVFPIMITDTGKLIDMNLEVTSFLASNKLSNFENWTCNVGIESLFVHFNGDILRGNCGVGGIIGNITNMENIQWPTSSIICNKDICHCDADIVLSKRATS
jgi:radical SAM protein with 4Fe4S-binding SPASM domain